MHARVAIKACVREQEQAARRVQNEATIMGPLRGLRQHCDRSRLFYGK